MNYYGTRRRGHDLAFHSHSELRDALFASGLPFLVSINDVPEAWELYSRAGSITRLCSGKNGSKPELLEIAVETVEKKSLSPFNDKVYGLDAHNSRPLGHWRNLEQLRMLGAYAPPGSAPFDLFLSHARLGALSHRSRKQQNNHRE